MDQPRLHALYNVYKYVQLALLATLLELTLSFVNETSHSFAGSFHS